MVTSCPVMSAESLLRSVEGELVFQVRGSCRDGQIIRLRSPKCTIGSARHCTLRLRARGVRPTHCLVLRGRRRILVRRWAPDTRLNGHPFEDAPLAPGDCLSVGPIDLVLLDPSESQDVSRPETRSTASEHSAGSHVGDEESTMAGTPFGGSDRSLRDDDRLAEANRIHRRRSRQLLKRLREARQMIAQLLEEPRHPDGEVREDADIKQQAAAIATQAEALARRETALAAKRHEFEEARQRTTAQLEEGRAEIEQRRRGLDARQDRIDAQQVLFDQQREQWERTKDEQGAALEALRSELEALREELDARQKALDLRQESLDVRQVELKARQYRTESPRSGSEPRNTEVILPDEFPQSAAGFPPEAASPDDGHAEAESADDSAAEATPAQTSHPLPPSVDTSAPGEAPRAQGEPSAQQNDPGRPEPLAELEEPHRDEHEAAACEETSTADESPRPQPAADRDTGYSPEAGRRTALGGISPTDADDDEASIDDYMAQLVARVRQATDRPPAPGPVAPPPPQETERREAPPPPPQPEASQGPAPPQQSQPRENPPPPREPKPREDPAPPEQLEAREDPAPPASSPEPSYDLSALRELADLSDRSVSDQYARRRLVRLLKGKALVASTGLVAGAVLIALWYTHPGLPIPYYAGPAGLIVALVWGIQYAVLKGKVGVTESGHLQWKDGPREPDPRSDQPSQAAKAASEVPAPSTAAAEQPGTPPTTVDRCADQPDATEPSATEGEESGPTPTDPPS